MDDKNKRTIGIVIGVALILLIVVLLLIKGCGTKEYQVTFNQNNGKDPIIVNVKKGDKVSKPSDPVKEGYTFVGWYDGDKLYDFNTEVNKNLTLNAKYNENTVDTEDQLAVDALSIILGDESTINITSLPKGYTKDDLVFTSSDETIVTVDANGKVKAIKAGNAIITIKTKDGKYSVDCNVTVTEEKIAVEGIKITGKNEMTVGSTQTLKLTFTPSNATNKSVTYKSSNTALAKVDRNGKVTAYKEGKVTITVTTADGSYTDTIEITIKPAPKVAVTGVTIAGGDRTMTVGDTAKLTANVAPTNASNKSVTWTSSDSTIVSVDQSGNIKALKEGDATITVTTKDGNKTASIKVHVNPKPVNYVVTFTAKPQEVTGAILQYSISVTKDGTAIDYKAISFTTVTGESRTVQNGSFADKADITNGTSKVTSATIILRDNTKITTNVTVVVK